MHVIGAHALEDAVLREKWLSKLLAYGTMKPGNPRRGDAQRNENDAAARTLWEVITKPLR